MVDVHGVSLALRTPHLSEFLLMAANRKQGINIHQALSWVELTTDNWLHQSGLDQQLLLRVCDSFDIALHGVGMNLGGMAPLDWGYLRKLKDLVCTTQAKVVSDHVCFNQVGGRKFHDLLPVPYNYETLDYMARRIEQVQDYLGLPILVENASAYLAYRSSCLSEASFLNLLADESGCGLLLDVNNVFVSCSNLNLSTDVFFSELDFSNVHMLHLGGHTDKGAFLLDSHSEKVSDHVWGLYEKTLKLKPNIPTVIEWDNSLPSFDVLMAERAKAEYFVRDLVCA